MRFVSCAIVATLIDILLILLALSFSDPLPPLVIAILLWPMILFIMLVSTNRVSYGNMDLMKYQNFSNIDAMRRDIKRFKD